MSKFVIVCAGRPVTALPHPQHTHEIIGLQTLAESGLPEGEFEAVIIASFNELEGLELAEGIPHPNMFVVPGMSQISVHELIDYVVKGLPAAQAATRRVMEALRPRGGCARGLPKSTDTTEVIH